LIAGTSPYPYGTVTDVMSDLSFLENIDSYKSPLLVEGGFSGPIRDGLALVVLCWTLDYTELSIFDVDLLSDYFSPRIAS
jgi:hypothetical protein